ncbi:MAG TPA: protein kinase [Polyangiaceae bacterium]|nr:protein kinase [Polyangiaceae bacterium]
MLKPGDTFGRYTIEALIGQGGMGCVYRAYDPRLDRRVALKVISEAAASPDANARLLREARAAAAFEHPNAVSIFDVGELDGAPYIVMELVKGRTLRRAHGDTGAPIPARVAQLADVARALAAAHKRGLVHRDVKPENVMVSDDGLVKVLDFGIARRTGGTVDPRSATQPALPTITVEGVKIGTPVYMAPEQIRGDALDGRADQFAWGVLAYELLAEKLPWRGAGDALAVMASTLTDPVDPSTLERAGVPPAVASVVLRALEKRPSDRFSSMDELWRALESAARGETLVQPAKVAPVEGTTMAQQFSTSEVREVLGHAIEQRATKQNSVKLGFEDLIGIAAEVGVDVESLREASRALRSRNEEQLAASAHARERDAWLRQQRLVFYRHAGIYVIVNVALLVLGLVLLSFTPWWIWFLPALAWSVGLAIHGLVAFTSNEHDWAEHHQGMQWWLENRQHELALARGADAVVRRRKRRDAPRRRIAPAEGEKQRIGAGRIDEADDMDEADADELMDEPAVKRRQRSD